jgi:hypothetical protein
MSYEIHQIMEEVQYQNKMAFCITGQIPDVVYFDIETYHKLIDTERTYFIHCDNFEKTFMGLEIRVVDAKEKYIRVGYSDNEIMVDFCRKLKKEREIENE